MIDKQTLDRAFDERFAPEIKAKLQAARVAVNCQRQPEQPQRVLARRRDAQLDVVGAAGQREAVPARGLFAPQRLEFGAGPGAEPCPPGRGSIPYLAQSDRSRCA